MPTGLDTNILIYALDSEAGEKHAKAVEIVADVLRNPEKYMISVQVLAETLYVVKRKKKGINLASRLIMKLIKRVPTTSYTAVEILQAMDSPKRYFWDRLLAYTHRNNGVTEITTGDEKPYKGIIQTKNPFRAQL